MLNKIQVFVFIIFAILSAMAICYFAEHDLLLYAQMNKPASTGNHPAATVDVDNAPEPLPDDDIPF